MPKNLFIGVYTNHVLERVWHILLAKCDLIRNIYITIRGHKYVFIIYITVLVLYHRVGRLYK